MRTIEITPTLPERFSMAWAFVVLTILFKDIHEMFRPGFLTDAARGMSNGTPVSEMAVFYGGVAVTALVAMIFTPRFLTHAANRRVNGLAALIAMLLVATTPRLDLDDAWFAAVQLIALIWILVAALRGRG